MQKTSPSRIYPLKFLYVSLLIASSLLSGTTFQFLYFTLPLASLLIPILFLLVSLMAFHLKPFRLAKFLLICSLLNLITVAFLCRNYNLNLDDFWILGQSLNPWQIYVLLSSGFHVGLIIALGLIYTLHLKLPYFPYIKLMLAVLFANIVDVVFMWPTLIAFTEDLYLSSWKLLTVATFKINMLLFVLPVGWCYLFYHQKKIKQA